MANAFDPPGGRKKRRKQQAPAMGVPVVLPARDISSTRPQDMSSTARQGSQESAYQGAKSDTQHFEAIRDQAAKEQRAMSEFQQNKQDRREERQARKQEAYEAAEKAQQEAEKQAKLDLNLQIEKSAYNDGIKDLLYQDDAGDWQWTVGEGERARIMAERRAKKEQESREAEEKKRLEPINAALKKKELLLDDPTSRPLGSTDRGNVEKELAEQRSKARDSISLALGEQLRSARKAAKGGLFGIGGDDEAETKAQALESRLNRYIEDPEADLEDADLGDLRGLNPDLSAQLEALQHQLWEDDQRQADRQVIEDEIYKLKVQRDDPERYAQMEVDRLRHAPEEELDAEDMQLAQQEAEAAESGMILEANDLRRQEVLLEDKQRQQTRGLAPSDAVTLPDSDGGQQVVSKDAAAILEELDSQEAGIEDNRAQIQEARNRMAEERARREINSTLSGVAEQISQLAGGGADYDWDQAFAQADAISEAAGIDRQVGRNMLHEINDRSRPFVSTERSRVSFSGKILINPEYIWDDDEVEAIIDTANGATPEARAEAMEQLPAMRDAAAPALLMELSKSKLFRKWDEKHGGDYASQGEKIMAFREQTPDWRKNLDESLRAPGVFWNAAANELYGINKMILDLHGESAKRLGLEGFGSWIQQKAADTYGAAYEVNQQQIQEAHDARKAVMGDDPLITNTDIAQGLGSLGPSMAAGGGTSFLAKQAGKSALAKMAVNVIGTGGRHLVGSTAKGMTFGAKTKDIAQLVGLRGAVGGAFTQSFAATYNDATQDYLAQGYGESEARDLAALNALGAGLSTAIITRIGGARGVEAVFGHRNPTIGQIFEKFGREGFLKAIRSKGVRSDFVKIAGSGFENVSSETLEEGYDQFAQGMIEKMDRNPEKTWSDIVNESMEAGAIGGILGGGVPAVKGSGEAAMGYTQGKLDISEEQVAQEAADATIAYEMSDEERARADEQQEELSSEGETETLSTSDTEDLPDTGEQEAAPAPEPQPEDAAPAPQSEPEEELPTIDPKEAEKRKKEERRTDAENYARRKGVPEGWVKNAAGTATPKTIDAKLESAFGESGLYPEDPKVAKTALKRSKQTKTRIARLLGPEEEGGFNAAYHAPELDTQALDFAARRWLSDPVSDGHKTEQAENAAFRDWLNETIDEQGTRRADAINSELEAHEAKKDVTVPEGMVPAVQQRLAAQMPEGMSRGEWNSQIAHAINEEWRKTHTFSGDGPDAMARKIGAQLARETEADSIPDIEAPQGEGSTQSSPPSATSTKQEAPRPADSADGAVSHSDAQAEARGSASDTGQKPDSDQQVEPESTGEQESASEEGQKSGIQRVLDLANTWEGVARQTEGGRGMPVGTGNIEYRWRTDLLRSLVQKVRSGMPLNQAVEETIEEGRRFVRKHNAQRPNDHNWQRWEESNDSNIRQAGATIAKFPEPSESPELSQVDAADTLIDGTLTKTAELRAKVGLTEVREQEIGGSGIGVDNDTGELVLDRDAIKRSLASFPGKEAEVLAKSIEEEVQHAATLAALHAKFPNKAVREKTVAAAYAQFAKNHGKHADALGALYSEEAWGQMSDYRRGMETINIIWQTIHGDGNISTAELKRLLLNRGIDQAIIGDAAKAFSELVKSEGMPVDGAFRSIIQAIVDWIRGEKRVNDPAFAELVAWAEKAEAVLQGEKKAEKLIDTDPRTPQALGSIYQPPGSEKFFVQEYEGKRGMGDTIHATLEEAEQFAELHKKQTAQRKQNLADLEAEKKKEAEDKEAQKTDSIARFTEGKTPMQRGTIRKTLEKLGRFDGKVMTRREKLEQLAESGATLKTKDGERRLYTDDSTFYEQKVLTKIGFDYFEWLQGQRESNAPVETPSDLKTNTKWQDRKKPEAVFILAEIERGPDGVKAKIKADKPRARVQKKQWTEAEFRERFEPYEEPKGNAKLRKDVADAGKGLSTFEKKGTEAFKGLFAPVPERDAEYMAAVNSGDMDKAQRMVDEAAKRAGYDVGPVYHGTRGKKKGQFPFDVFDTARRGKNTTAAETPTGSYFAENRGYAEGAAYLASNMGRDGKPVVGAFYLKGAERTPGVETAVEYVATDPNQIKSAEPVTRDSQGNVISLSERFDDSSDSILYSPSPEQEALPADRLGQFTEVAQGLISEGINTPAKLVESLDRMAEANGKPKALRKFAESFWLIFRAVDPSLAKDPDWSEVFRQNADIPNQEKAATDENKPEQPDTPIFTRQDLEVGKLRTTRRQGGGGTVSGFSQVEVKTPFSQTQDHWNELNSDYISATATGRFRDNRPPRKRDAVWIVEIPGKTSASGMDSEPNTIVARNLTYRDAIERAKDSVMRSLPGQSTGQESGQPDTPAEAAEEVEEHLEDTTEKESPKDAREVKKELLAKIKEAIKTAPATAKLIKGPWAAHNPPNPKELPDNQVRGEGISVFEAITVTIPGDGTFKVRNEKPALEEVLKRVSKLKVDEKPKKPPYRALSSKKLSRPEKLKNEKQAYGFATYEANGDEDATKILDHFANKGDAQEKAFVRRARDKAKALMAGEKPPVTEETATETSAEEPPAPDKSEVPSPLPHLVVDDGPKWIVQIPRFVEKAEVHRSGDGFAGSYGSASSSPSLSFNTAVAWAKRALGQDMAARLSPDAGPDEKAGSQVPSRDKIKDLTHAELMESLEPIARAYLTEGFPNGFSRQNVMSMLFSGDKSAHSRSQTVISELLERGVIKEGSDPRQRGMYVFQNPEESGNAEPEQAPETKGGATVTPENPAESGSGVEGQIDSFYDKETKQDIATGKPVSFDVAHNPNSSPPPSAEDPYQQKQEPAGKYLTPVSPNSGGKIAHLEYDKVQFSNPLVLEWRGYGEDGWKARLSKAFGGLTGKKLTKALRDAGYDAVITATTASGGGMYATETVQLEPANRDTTEKTAQSSGTKKKTSGTKAKKPADPTGIQDFGEKIGGARKDVWGKMTEKYVDGLPTDLSNVTLSKNFPEPDYGKLLDEGTPLERVVTFKALRDLIPPKPRASWKRRQWERMIPNFHRVLTEVIAGEGFHTAGDLHQKALDTFPGLADRIDFYKVLGFPAFTKAKDWEVKQSQGLTTMWRGKEVPKSHYTTIVRKNYRTDFDLSTVNESKIDGYIEAIANLKQALASEPEPSARKKRSVKFSVYQDRSTGELFIGKKGLNDVIRLQTGFKTSPDAFTYIAENQEALEKQWAGLKVEPAMRRAANNPRKGPDRRKGDVTPEVFQETFGFYGVEFGNWVEGERRQADLNEAYDALMDLSQALDIPPMALSLNGSLGLAFGARGRKGAKAHYELSKIVINLTKKTGPGSLAHEWFHGVDHYFARLNETDTTKRPGKDSGVPVVDDFGTRSYKPAIHARPQVWEALQNLTKSFGKKKDEGSFLFRSLKADQTKSKPYFSTKIEMAARAFEAYVVRKLKNYDTVNDFLVNIDKENSPIYPTDAELEAGIEGAFDDVFKAMDYKQTDTGVMLYAPAIEQSLAALPKKPQALVNGILDGLTPEEAAVAAGYPAERAGVMLGRVGEALARDWRKRGITQQEARQGLEGVLRGKQAPKPKTYHTTDGRILMAPVPELHHGTPHKVDRFSLEKIGTGEGAQAYGWGLYFAEAKGVAASYRESLSYGAVETEKGERVSFYKGTSAQRYAVQISNDAADEMDIRNSELADNLGDVKQKTIFRIKERAKQQGPERQEFFKEAIEYVESWRPATGNLYSVEIQADTEEFLDWDKPLSDQWEKVQKALPHFREAINERLGVEFQHSGKRRSIKEMSGESFYRYVSNVSNGFEEGSKRLLTAGIKGIRYLDGDSRNTTWSVTMTNGEVMKHATQSAAEEAQRAIPGSVVTYDGTYNYVIFDPSIIKITTENGEPVTLPQDDMLKAPSPESERHAALEAKHNAGTITPEETAEAQRLVDEAAKAAGYTVGPVYHGTSPSDWTVFEVPETGTMFATRESMAELFGRGRTKKKHFNETGSFVGLPDPRVIRAYLKPDNYRAAHQFEFKSLKEEGIDTTEADGVWVVRNPNQIKSAEPFTGTPLHERFNPESDSILRAPVPELEDRLDSIVEASQTAQRGWGWGVAKLIDRVTLAPLWAENGPLKALGRSPAANNALDKWFTKQIGKAAKGLSTAAVGRAVGRAAGSMLDTKAGKAMASMGESAWKAFERQFIPNRLRSRELTAIFNEMRIAQQFGAQKGLDVMRSLKGAEKLTDIGWPDRYRKDRKVHEQMFMVLDGSADIDSLPQSVHHIVHKLRAMLTAVGEEAVLQGRLSRSTFEEFKDRYVPHYFAQDESVLRKIGRAHKRLVHQGDMHARRLEGYRIEDTETRDPYDKELNALVNWAPGKWRFHESHRRDAFYERLIMQTVAEQAQKFTNPSVGGKYAVSREGAEAIKALTVNDLNRIDQLSPEVRGWVAERSKAARKRFKKGQPLDIEDQKEMGLITDPVYAVARHIVQMSHDNAVAKLFNQLSANPEVISETDLDGFKPIPDDSRFGAIAGLYVREDLYEQLEEIAMASDGFLSVMDKSLTFWKTGKTVLNPGTHMRNVMGNIVFSQFAGSNVLNPSNATYYRDALRVLRDGGPKLKEAMEQGVIGNDFASAELADAMRKLVPSTDLVEGKVLSPWEIGAMVVQKAGQAGLGKVFDLYGMEDDIYKLATHLKYRAQGMDPKAAAAEVRKWFPYYDDIGMSTGIKWTRRMIPFFSFQREAIRVMLNAARERPLMLANSLGLLWALSKVSAVLLGLSDEDEEDVNKVMRGHMKFFGTEGPALFSLLLPMRGADGRLMQFDTTNVMPFANLLGNRLETGKEEPFATELGRYLVSQNPLSSNIVSLAANRDLFFGDSIYEENMTEGEKAKAMADHVWASLMPPLVPGGTSFKAIERSGQRTTNKTLEKRSRGQAVLRAAFGLDVRNASPDIYDAADKFREAMGLEKPDYADHGSTPKSRARAELWGELVQDEPNLEVIGKLLTYLETEHGDIIKGEQAINRLLYYRNPLMVIGGDPLKEISASDMRRRFRSSQIGTEVGQALEESLTEYERIKKSAPLIIRQAHAHNASISN